MTRRDRSPRSAYDMPPPCRCENGTVAATTTPPAEGSLDSVVRAFANTLAVARDDLLEKFKAPTMMHREINYALRHEMAARRISWRISAQEFTEALKKNVTAHGESAVIDPYRQNVVTVRRRPSEISPSRASR